MRQKHHMKQKIILILLIILLLLSIIPVKGIIVEPGREWEIENETYTVNQTMDFSRIIISEDDDYMYENNTIFASIGKLIVYGELHKGQQFTIGAERRNTTFNITQVTVWCQKEGVPPTPCYVSIYNVDGNGHPTGSVLSQGTFDPSDAVESGGTGTIYNITMSPQYKLLSGVMYAVILNATGGDSSNRIELRDAAGDWYTGGENLGSTDGGETWSLPTGSADAFFEIYGTTSYVCFNNTGFNVTSINNILITLDYINEDIKNVAEDTKVLGFYADTITNDVWMNISGFSIDTRYDVYRDDVLHDSYTTDSTGMLFIFSSSWLSEHLFNVYSVGNSAPAQSNPSPSNETTGVGVSTSSVSITVNDADSDSLDWTIETSPNVGSDSGSGEGNGVKSCSVSGLAYDITYTWYMNVTDGNYWTNNSYWFTTESDTAPSISNPNPSNGSTGVSVSTSSISATIVDSETTFNWTITTNPNIGSDNANDENDGTKTCTISGLNYDAVYYWTVTAYDGTTWTNRTYHFTVEEDPVGPPPNSAPVISEEYPEDESVNVVLQPYCHVKVTDANIDPITVNIYNSTDGITYYWQQKNSSVPTGTTIYWDYNQASEYDTLYYWRVYANDGTINISRILSFTTYTDAPVITDYSPADGAVDVIRNTTVTVTILNYQGDTMNITWRSNSGGSWIDFGYNNSINNGTYSQKFINSTESGTRYWWSVNVSDGTDWTNETYSFTTEVRIVPVISDPIPRDGRQLVSIYLTNISVVIDDVNNDFDYTIETSPDIGSISESGVASGVKTCTVSGLNYSTTYTWYVNATNGETWTNVSYTFTTKGSTDFDLEDFKLNLPEWAMGPYKVYVGDFVWMFLFVGVIAITWGSSKHISSTFIVILLIFAAYGGQRVFVDNSEISLLFSIIAAVCIAAIMLGLFLKKKYG